MATKSKTGCRLCGALHLVQCLRLENAPQNISRLLREDELAQDRSVTIEVFECGRCGFVQLAEILEAGFYDDYMMTVSHSSQMRAYQNAQAKAFVDHFQLQGKRVVEVGCGDGNYLEGLQKHGAIVSGIEPSAKFGELAQSRGLRVHHGYVTAVCPVPEAPYDAFVTRQVLEHVPDPGDFLTGIRLSLTADAVGLVEVPSLEQALENQRFYDFFPDHLNYFSERTLRLALEMSGFRVIQVQRTMNGEYNEAWVAVDAKSDFASMQTSIGNLSADLHAMIDAYEKTGKRIAIWGAGAKGLVAMAVAGIKSVAYVVDSDPNKQGGLTPVTHLIVSPPGRLVDDPVDAVVVTAMAYRNEILDQLRNELNFKGQVAFLGVRLEFVE